MDFKGMQKLLWRCGGKKKIIDDMLEEINELNKQKDRMREVKGIFISGMPKGKSVGDVMGKRVILLDEIDQSINERIGSVMKKMEENHAVLDMVREVLNIEEYKIILERYLKGYKWDFIPGRVMMSRSSCFYIHERAIKKLVAEWNRAENTKVKK